MVLADGKSDSDGSDNASDVEGLIEKPISNKEEMRFIAQAAIAPISIFKRILLDHNSFGSSFIQAFDRDEYVKNLRRRKRSKLPPEAA